MRFYSDILNTPFDTEEQLLTAEKEHEDKLAAEKAALEAKKKAEADRKAERANDAKAIDEARHTMNEAQNKYRELITAFVKKYGTYRYSTTDVDDIPLLFDSIFNWF